MAAQVRMDVRMWEFVSFAMAHNSIDFVKGVRLSGLLRHSARCSSVNLVSRPSEAKWLAKS